MPRPEQIEALLKDDPDDVFLHYALAMAWASDGRNAEAIARLEEVVARDANYVAAYFQCGRLRAEQGDAEGARDVLARGVDAAHRAGDAHAEGEIRGLIEMLG